MYSGGSEFVTKFLSVLKLLIYKIYFWHQYNFPFHIYESLADANSKQQQLLDWDSINRDKGDPSVQIFLIILEICQYDPFDIITVTPRGTLGLYCVHIAQLMTHPAIYTTPFTLQLCYKPLGILQRVTKSQKVHISDHDGLGNLHNINFVWHRSEGFPERKQSSRNFPLPQSRFLRTIDLVFFKQYVYYSLTSIY